MDHHKDQRSAVYLVGVRGVADGGEPQARVREGGALRGVGVPRGAHHVVRAGRAALRRLHAVAALHVPHHLRQRLPIQQNLRLSSTN